MFVGSNVVQLHQRTQLETNSVSAVAALHTISVHKNINTVMRQYSGDNDNQWRRLHNSGAISQLTFLSKIVERVVTKQFTSHAALDGLFPERQSAYRQFHSTESAVLVLHNDIVCARLLTEAKSPVSYFWIGALHSTVDHTSLLSILESRFSVTGQSLAWFCEDGI